MDYRTLGRTDLRVSALCLGTMQFGWTADEPTSFAILDHFTAAGGTFLDTADMYSSWADGNPGGVSETIIGSWLKQRGNRQDVVVATKGRARMWEGPDGEGLSRAHLTRAVDDSLRRLQTDYIDLYQTHWPDESTPIEETLQTLDDMVQAGKIRFIGCSNISARQLNEALSVSEQLQIARYDTLQPHYNLAHRDEYEQALRDVCAEHRLGVIPYSPLAGGFLTGKYRRNGPQPSSSRAGSIQQRYFNEWGWRIVETLDQIAAALDSTPAQVALAWLIAQPTITAPIVGSNSIEQLSGLLNAVELTLDHEHLAALTQASEA